MPLDVLGCTRATLMHSTSVEPCLGRLGNLFKMHRDGGRLLQLLILNEEFLVNLSHQLVLITSLPFVHTARRSYRLSDPVSPLECVACSIYPPRANLNKPYHLEEGEVVTRFP